MATILVIDDDPLFAETVVDRIQSLNHEAHSAHCLRDGVRQATNHAYDVILLDVFLPDGNGLSAIHQLKEGPGHPQVIIITGQGDPDGAESAIKYGAWCYLEKHSIHREIVLALTRALQYRDAQEQAGMGARIDALKRDRLVGESRCFKIALDQLSKAVLSHSNVLISGESGTGKEAFARAIHLNSDRADRNFVVVDCAALPEQLVESVLFGHVRGAFTGADKGNRGLIRHADQGVLFLDEVGEMPLTLQKSFLRVLQERVFRPVGSQEEYHSDFRLICATNRDLDAMVARGEFRQDLYHRLNGLHLVLPPLRERRGDIRLLTAHFLVLLCQRYGQETKICMDEFLDYLEAYPWPGNVRELHHTIESAFSQAFHAPVLFAQHLPLHIQTSYARATVQKNEPDPGSIDRATALAGELLPWREARDRFEQEYLERLLTQTDGNIMEAGRLSGLSRTRLYQLIKKYPPQQ